LKFANRYFESLLTHGLTFLWEKYQRLPGSACSPEDFRHQLSALLDTSLDETLTPQIREFGILVSDLRGFTPMLEQYPPLKIVELLNHYYKVMIRIIDQHGGVVDKFMGDSVLAMFDSKDNSDAPYQLLACAVDMQLAMVEVNAYATRLGVAHLYMGIGLNYGTMVACDLGSKIYREVTVLGEQVNLASRVASYCLRGQVLVSEDTYALLEKHIVPGSFNLVHIKGKSQPITLCEVLGIARPVEKLLPILDARRSLRVEVDLPITYFPIENKNVSKRPINGRIIDISRQGMRIISSEDQDFLQEIKLLFAFIAGSDGNDIYAKVLSCKEVNTGEFLISMEFTYVDEPTNKAIHMFVDHLA